MSLRERRGACLHVGCNSTTEVVTKRALVGTCRATLSFVEECEPEFIQTRAFRACNAEIVDVAADEKLVNVSILPISHGFIETDSLESLFIYENGHGFEWRGADPSLTSSGIDWVAPVSTVQIHL